ncbi:response regulator [Planctomycetes bacterium K23_9]|uniref:Transcriptional regulatory protein AfsQ1 n=1 Tax=Stieleria marina TaxID=1930275 RepID=A0A517NM03_9BACT|nr:Transcriptional regulatory protein AfsQ1 [Planctomycetes bacterium K23_9]
MTDKTVLVIDDSATIRKLVDTHLTPAGYRVVLAPNAEDGVRLAGECSPDLILLDHQLPGTTGYDVCCKLVEIPELRSIPVVISSTLRKKAYAEYVDLDNVVDMLPKPYTEQLLLMTVANALETAAMVVTSQSQGSAVPEVINQQSEAELAGSLTCFGLRELLDFLNNGRKSGVLEVEADRARIRFHLDKGRIQGVYGSGMDPDDIEKIVSQLPDSLSSLAPVLRMTMSGRSCAEVDGFVQLLDQKVLDPRLMTKLLRFQASMLVQLAFEQNLNAFRFELGHSQNALHKNLPLDISLLALLVEAAMCSDDPQATSGQNQSYVRRAIRGQNLDRAGLPARHMKILNLLSDPKSHAEIQRELGWSETEVRQVLRGFVMAELVEIRSQVVAGNFVVFEPNAAAAQNLRAELEASDNRYAGKVVRDKLALQLVLKRSIPHTLAFAADDDMACQLIAHLFSTSNPKAANVKRIALLGDADAHAIDWNDRVGFTPDDVLQRPCTAELLFRSMDRLFDDGAEQAQHETEAQENETQHAPPLSAGDSDANSPIATSSFTALPTGVEA